MGAGRVKIANPYTELFMNSKVPSSKEESLSPSSYFCMIASAQ